MKEGDKCFYYGDPCRITIVYGDTLTLQSESDPKITYDVSKTSRFLELEDGLKKHAQKTNLVVR